MKWENCWILSGRRWSLSWFGMLRRYLLYEALRLLYCTRVLRSNNVIMNGICYDVHSRLISLPFRDDVSPYPHEYRKEYRTIGLCTEKYVIKKMISLLRRICQLLFIIIFSFSYSFWWWTESQSFHINKYPSLIPYYSDFILCCILIVLLYTSHNIVDKKNNWNVLKMCTLYSCIPIPFPFPMSLPFPCIQNRCGRGSDRNRNRDDG